MMEGQITDHQFDEWMEEELELSNLKLAKIDSMQEVLKPASTLFSEMIKKDEFDEFLTLPAYNYLN